MKKLLSLMLVCMLVLPALAPWMPHGAMHALHDNHIAADHSFTHTHSHDDHLHSTDTHHPINVDIVSYYKDYLHVDLKKPEKTLTQLPLLDLQHLDILLPLAIYPVRDTLAYLHNRAPPDYALQQPDKLPLYLSTQRLRI
jgi:hypothetical protein